MSDLNNFEMMFVGSSGFKFKIQMIEGLLLINDCEYEKLDDDPMYDFVRYIYKKENEK